MKLTSATVQGAKPGEKTKKLADGRGLTLVVEPSGTKFWRLRYRRAGKETQITLGWYPAMSLAAARDAAQKARTTKAEGADPVREKRRQQAARDAQEAQTFETVARAYMASRTSWVPSHAARFRHRMERDVFPEIGRIPVAELTAADVVQACQPPLSRGATDTAKRVVGMVGQVMRRAIVLGHAKSDPTVGLAAALCDSPPTQHRATILDPEDLGAFLDRVWSYPHETAGRTIVQLAALTAARPGEIRAMQWDDLDLEGVVGGRWTYRVSKVGVEHIAPLSRQAVEIIRSQPQRHALVFGNPTTGKPVSDVAPTQFLRKIGYASGEMTAHGLRATFRTHAVETLGASPEVAERALTHAPRAVHGRAYDRTAYLAERTKLAQAWADWLDVQRSIARAERLGIKVA